VIWRVSDKSIVAEIPAHSGGVDSAAFSLDGKRIASAGADGRIRLWDIASKSELREFERHDGVVVELAFRPDSDDIAGAVMRLPCRPGYPGEVVIWNATTGNKRLVIAAHAEAAYSVAYSRDGRRLASCGGAAEGSLSQPGEVKVWHADTGIELLPLAGSAGRDSKQGYYYKEETYTAMKPVHETYEVEEVRDGEKIKVQKIATRMVPETHVRKVPGGGSRVWWETPGAATDVAFSDDGFRLAAACEDGTARIWDGFICQPHDTARWPAFSANTIAKPISYSYKRCAPSEAQIAASADGRWIVVGDGAGDQCDSLTGILRVFDAKTGRLVREIGPLDNSPRALSFSSNNRWVAVALTWAQMGQPMVHYPDGSSKPVGPAPAPRGGFVEVWDVTTGERVSEFKGHEEYAMAVAFDPSGKRVVSGGRDGLRLWDAKSGSELKAAKTAFVWGVAWNSDRRVLYLSWAGHGGGAAAAREPTSTDRVHFVSMPSQGGPAPRELGVWDVDAAAPPRMLKTLTGNINFAPHPLAFDAVSGRAIVACTVPGTIGNERGQLQFIPIGKPNSAQVQTLGRGMLWSVAVSGDGKRLVTAGADWHVNVWDAERRGQLLHLGGHIDDVRGAVFLPDGRVASVGADRQLKVWHANDSFDRTAACHEFESPRKRTTRLGGSGSRGPYGHGMYGFNVSRLVAARQAPVAATVEVIPQQQRGWRNPIRAFDAKSGAELPQWPGHSDVVRGVAVRPDGERIASCGQDMYVALWAADNSSKIDMRHPNKVMHVVYSPDGSRVTSSTAFDGKVWIWDAKTGLPVRDFQADPTTTFALAYNPDGDLLATGGIGRTIALRNAETGEIIRTLEGHTDTVQHVTFSHDGRWLASASHDKTAKLWNVETGELVRTFGGFTAQVWETAFSPDDRLIAVGGWEPTVRLFEVESGNLVKELAGHDRGVWSVAFSPDGKQLAACGREQPLIVWDWERGEQLFTAVAAGECLAYWPDGSRIVTGNVLASPSGPQQPKFDSIVRVWNTETSSPRGSLKLEGVQVIDLAVSRDGTHVAAAGQDGSVHLWEGRGNEEFAPTPAADFRASDRPIWSVAFSADGQSIATASHDDVVRVWTSRGEAQFELKPAGGPCRLAFHPNGQQLAIGCADRNVRVWNLTTKQETAVFRRHFGDVTDLEFSPDGSRLAVTSRRGAPQGWTGDLKVWDVATGRRIVSTRAHSWWDARLAFHPTLPHIAITGIDHTVQVRHTDTGQLVLSVPAQGHMIASLGFTHTGDRLMFARGGEVLMVDSAPEPSPLGLAAGPAADTETQSATDEAAARWALEKGGRVHVRADGIVDEIANAADLPTDPYVVTAVLIGGGRGDITDADVAVLSPLEHLTTLHLNVPGVTDAAFESLASLNNLRAIHAAGSKVTGSFFAAIRDRKQLKGLVLPGSQLNDAGIQNLAGFALADCSVYDTAITDVSMSVLRHAVTGGLSVARTKITDAGLAQLAGFRGQSLIIDGTAVTDAGLRTFFASKPPLQHLGVAHTAVTDAVIDALAEIKTLQNVSVQGTKVTADGAARLKAAIPNCNVHR
jgi:WD40 repeat protein